MLMNQHRFPALLLAAALPLLSMTACGAAAAAAPAETGTPAGVAVQTQRVSAGEASSDSTVSGTLVAEDEQSVMVSVAARCLDTYVSAGDRVEEGQILCRLELDSTLSNYKAAKLAHSAATQNYYDQAAAFAGQITAAEQSVALYEKMLSDTQALYEIGAASQLEVEQASLQLSSAQSQLQSAISGRNSTLSQLESSIQSALSGLQQLETALQNIDEDGNVVSPASGVLVSLNAVKDGYVTTSAPVAVINSTGKMQINVSVSEALISKLRTGDKADVYVAALDRRFTAAVKSTDQAANMMTKLYTVTLAVPEKETGLLSGMFAEVTFHTNTVEHAIVVPSEAILTDGTAQYVYIVENGAARYTPVETGMTNSGGTVVTDGLEEGMVLVTVGQSYLSDGASVRIVGED
ncbi:MAG: efflux RND transporter periplasmic adaptor subunit [Oscillospiraceae bacterium]|nr:efflux RND transporter periplasmic adaptor subunit [Oscillospiraceae bacterium]